MPRHPPCALNNEHTTNHTQQQCQKHHHHVCGRRELHKTQKNRNHTNHTPTTTTNQQRPATNGDNSMQFNARVHYTVLTQHPTPQPPPSNKASTVCYQHGLQPGDNAPDTQQCTNIQKSLCRLDKLRLWLRCISTRLKKLVAAEHASTSTTTTTTHPQKESGFLMVKHQLVLKNNAP